MITINGRDHPTIEDAAEYLGVSEKTVRTYIKKRIIDKPPKIEYGVRLVMTFPQAYLRKAKADLKRYRDAR